MPCDEENPYEGEIAYQSLMARRIALLPCGETTRMRYYATTFGKIVSISKRTKRMRFLKARKTMTGCVQVWMEGKNVSVAGLMARTFIVPDCGDPFLKIYHVDGNMANNDLRNLTVRVSA